MIAWFETGAGSGQEYGSDLVRRLGKEIAERFGIPYDKTKNLARIVGDSPLETLPADLDKVPFLWETGPLLASARRLLSEYLFDAGCILKSTKVSRHPVFCLNACARRAFGELT